MNIQWVNFIQFSHLIKFIISLLCIMYYMYIIKRYSCTHWRIYPGFMSTSVLHNHFTLEFFWVLIFFFLCYYFLISWKFHSYKRSFLFDVLGKFNTWFFLSSEKKKVGNEIMMSWSGNKNFYIITYYSCSIEHKRPWLLRRVTGYN